MAELYGFVTVRHKAGTTCNAARNLPDSKPLATRRYVPRFSAVSHADLDLTLADLIADAACMHLPAPRPAPTRVIDLTVPAPRTIEIPEASVSLVEGYQYGV